MSGRQRRVVASALWVVMLAATRQAGADATFVIENADASGIGFNDPTPATPVGGNPGTTVGEQRMIAVQYAADLWGAALDSAVPIVVRASFDSLECTSSGAVLGQAGSMGPLSSSDSWILPPRNSV